MEDINLVEILIYMINFLVTFSLLYLLLYKPVSKFLGDRRERTVSSLKEAEETKKEAELILQEAKAELASTGEKSRQLAHETIENAALAAEKIIDNAQEEAAAMIVRAREQMEAERQIALERAFTDLVSFAGSLASRVMEREVSIEDNWAIVDHFFKENNIEFNSEGVSPSANMSKDKALDQKEKQI